MVLSPSVFNKPIDLALGVVIPLHSNIGLNYVISDYVPQALRTASRAGVAGLTLVTVLGLLKLNTSGPGLTETLKSLWREKKSA